jgi:hypothetical protein
MVEELLRERVRAGRVVPFVGAGISAPVYKMKWDTIITELAQIASARRRIDADTLSKAAESHGLTVVAELIRQYVDHESIVEALGKLLPDSAAPHEGHVAMVQGPWPAIVTTNWDGLLEKAWKQPQCKPHRDLWGDQMQTLYRSDLERFHASMKAGVRPLLLKVHGDLKRHDELVLSYRDYHGVMNGHGGLGVLMTWLSTEFSLLFYGHSLTDPDLQQFLEATHAGLGHGIGPHFWITHEIDDRSPMARFLRERFNVHVVHVGDVGGYVPKLREISAWGWQAPLGFSVRRTMPCNSGEGRLVVTIDSSAIDKGMSGEVALSLARSGDRVVAGTGKGSQMQTILGGQAKVDHVRFGDAGVGTPAIDDRFWLLSAQEKEGAGRPGLVDRVVRAWVSERIAAGATTLRLPLLASGGGRLPKRLAIQALLHAVGAASRELTRTLEVVVHVPDLARSGEALGEPSPLMEIERGVFQPFASVERGMRGFLRVTVVHPLLREPKRVVATVVHLDDGAGATLADLFEAIGWDAEAAARMVVEVPFRRSRDAPSLVDGSIGSGRLLRALDITDGSWVTVRSRT